MKLTRRLVVLHCLLFFALACGDTQCDCVTPPESPMAEEAKLYDAIQTRLTPGGLDFIESNLPEIIATFMQDGLVFDVPPTDASREFGWCPLCITIDLRICKNGCTLTAEIVDAGLSRVSPDTLALDARVNLSGIVTLNGTLNCDIPLTIRNKPVSANIRLYIDTIDHLMSFEITDVAFTLEDGDYNLACDWGFLSDLGLGDLIDDVVNWILGLLTPFVNDVLNQQLNDALDSALDDAVCLKCDFYTSGCPSGSTCADDFCKQDGTCRKNPLGMVGSINLGETSGDLRSSAALDIFVAAGQAQDPSVDPLVKNDGLEIRLIGGADSAVSDCVPTPDPAEIPSNQPPPRLPFDDTVLGTSTSFMAGFGISDAFLDWFLYKAYQSGLLCQNIGTETTDLLTSSTIGMLGLASLHDITGGRNTPVKLKILPTQVPYLEVGAGTFTDDGQGNQVIDEPLLYIFLPGVSMDFYVLIDERWIHIMTITLDMTMELGMDLDADNRLVFLFDEESLGMDNLEVSNYELLAEDPETLEELLPTLVGMALPMLTDTLAPIEIPPIAGFRLNIVAIQGDLPRAGTDYYEYMTIYANLEMAPPPPPKSRSTRARIAKLNVPDLERMSIRRAGGPIYPEIIIEVATDEGGPAEYSWRLDRGLWRPFSPGPRLVIHDPVLALMGKHTLEVRARTPGDYRSLDPTPTRLTFEIQPPKASLGPSTASRLTARPQARTRAVTVTTHQRALTDSNPQTEGCACGGRYHPGFQGGPNGSGGFFMLLLFGLLACRFCRNKTWR
jgi:hypothetical protein